MNFYLIKINLKARGRTIDCQITKFIYIIYKQDGPIFNIHDGT